MNLTWALTYTLISVVTSSIMFLIYRHVKYDMGARKEIELFRVFLLAFLAFALCNGVCVWANHYRLGLLGTVFTTLNLSALCASAYCWFCYIQVRLNPVWMEKKAYRFIMPIPITIVILIIATSPLTHLIFYYDPSGAFHRGPIYPIILITAFLYLVVASVHAYRGLAFVKTRAQKKQYHCLIIFILFPFLAGVIDFLFAHLPSMELVVLFGIVLIYLNLQQAQVYRDGLTGLNNRRLTDEYLEESIAFASEKKPIYYFLADIDRFKSINDRFGHLEGDRALKLVADVLKKYMDNEHCYISRWGGDEFVIIVDAGENFDPEAFMHKISEDVRQRVTARRLQYDISLSIGYVRCIDPGMETDRIIRIADQRMYVNKTRTG